MSYLPVQQDCELDIDSEHHPHHHSWNHCQCRRTKYLTIYSAIVTTLLCVLLITDVVLRRHHNDDDHRSIDAGREFDTTFGSDNRYMSLDHRYDYLWDEDLNGGEDKVIDLIEEQEPLLDVQGNDIGHPASISMFHQLHCLAAMRKALQDARAGVDIGIDFHDNTHWPHCFDYMRKTIRCWADSSLERTMRLENGSATHSINGVTDIRRCRKTEPLYDFVREHPLYNTGEEEDGHGHVD